jgi:hypothetical protein
MMVEFLDMSKGGGRVQLVIQQEDIDSQFHFYQCTLLFGKLVGSKSEAGSEDFC